MLVPCAKAKCLQMLICFLPTKGNYRSQPSPHLYKSEPKRKGFRLKRARVAGVVCNKTEWPAVLLAWPTRPQLSTSGRKKRSGEKKRNEERRGRYVKGNERKKMRLRSRKQFAAVVARPALSCSSSFTSSSLCLSPPVLSHSV